MWLGQPPDRNGSDAIRGESFTVCNCVGNGRGREQTPSAEDESKRHVSRRPGWGRVLDCHGGRRKATDKNAFGRARHPRGVSLFAKRKVVVRRAASRVVYVGRGSLPGKRWQSCGTWRRRTFSAHRASAGGGCLG